MATEIVMPQLGLTMTEGTVVKWLKQEGEEVKKGEPLLEVETDKVVQEVNSLDEGVLSRIVVGEGEPVPVGTVIALMSAPGETGVPTPLARPEPAARPAGLVVSADTPDTGNGKPSEGLVRASPIAKNLAAKLGIDLKTLRGSGPMGRILEGDVRRAAEARTSVPTVEPSVQRPAEPSAPAEPARAPVSLPSTVEGERVELKGIRKVVAERMSLSFSTAPHFYLTAEVDAAALVALRAQLLPAVQKRLGVDMTVTDLLVKACALALRDHPYANASWRDGAIQKNRDVNVGVAIALEEGLVVPVVQGADRLSFGQIARRRSELVSRGRGGQLTLAELEGGTFTLTNLGMFGVDQFQAIVNPPQAAILAVGRIKDRIVAVDGQATVRPIMTVTLSVDHRILDGAAAARFLARVVELLENPVEMLIEDTLVG
jgi:pyruvate dehydrogenase E2 component (dihydrolipoamide acetyltransferase)